MARYLFVSWDGGGSVPPTMAMASKLVRRGHHVRVLGDRSMERAIEEAGAVFSTYERAPAFDSRSLDGQPGRDWESRSPIEAYRGLRDRLIFGPASAYALDVLAALEREPADVVVIDFMIFGAMVAAEASGVLSAVLVTSIYGFPARGVPPFGLPPAQGALGRLRDSALRPLAARLWNAGLPVLNAARGEVGLAPVSTVFEQLDRMTRVLVMSSAAFDFAARTPLPSNVIHIGPQFVARSTDHGCEDPWPADDPRPLVVVSLSTTFQGQMPLLERLVAALAGLPVRALVTSGPAVDPSLLAAAPNVAVRAYVPHGLVLPRASLVVTHAGHGTVMAGLSHGVPALCLPMGRDQNDNAARVVAAGAGRRLRAGATAAELAKAITDLLADDSARAGARRVASVIHREMEEDRGLHELEALARGSSGHRRSVPS